jgi:hypothetical protein
MPSIYEADLKNDATVLQMRPNPQLCSTLLIVVPFAQ